MFDPYNSLNPSYLSTSAQCYDGNNNASCINFTPNDIINKYSSNVFHGQKGPGVRYIPLANNQPSGDKILPNTTPILNPTVKNIKYIMLRENITLSYKQHEEVDNILDKILPVLTKPISDQSLDYYKSLLEYLLSRTILTTQQQIFLQKLVKGDNKHFEVKIVPEIISIEQARANQLIYAKTIKNGERKKIDDHLIKSNRLKLTK
jgi:acid stress-induced BolA-like protein IbaG/YrbA